MYHPNFTLEVVNRAVDITVLDNKFYHALTRISSWDIPSGSSSDSANVDNVAFTKFVFDLKVVDITIPPEVFMASQGSREVVWFPLLDCDILSPTCGDFVDHQSIELVPPPHISCSHFDISSHVPRVFPIDNNLGLPPCSNLTSKFCSVSSSNSMGELPESGWVLA